MDAGSGWGGGGEAPRNVLGQPLKSCCTQPMTGFYRTGRCETGPHDVGLHVVCAEMTAEFLAFSRAAGNDLSTPRPEYRFAGLKPGDRWCLCAARFMQAAQEFAAPQVVLEATHARTLEIVPIELLQRHAADAQKPGH